MIVCGKYSKKYGAGLRLIVVLAAFLLVVSPLAAWPTWLGGSATQDTQVLQMEKDILEKQEKIESITQLIGQLENQLADSKKISDERDNLISSLKSQLKNSKAALEKAESELKMLKELYGISEESYQAMKAKYEELKASYADKAEESEEYYEDVVTLTAEKKAESSFHGVLGASAYFAPDTGDISAELSMGVGIDNFTFILGAKQVVNRGLSLSLINPMSLEYKAGVQIRF